MEQNAKLGTIQEVSIKRRKHKLCLKSHSSISTLISYCISTSEVMSQIEALPFCLTSSDDVFFSATSSSATNFLKWNCKKTKQITLMPDRSTVVSAITPLPLLPQYSICQGCAAFVVSHWIFRQFWACEYYTCTFLQASQCKRSWLTYAFIYLRQKWTPAAYGLGFVRFCFRLQEAKYFLQHDWILHRRDLWSCHQ